MGDHAALVRIQVPQCLARITCGAATVWVSQPGCWLLTLGLSPGLGGVSGVTRASSQATHPNNPTIDHLIKNFFV